MNIELQLCGEDQAHVLRNLFPHYLHDISEFDALEINRHGVIGAGSDDVEASVRPVGAWWEKPRDLFPYLIWVDGSPVGFSLVMGGPYVEATIGSKEIDFVFYALFVAHSHRGSGVAARAAALCMDQHRGLWEVATYPKCGRNVAFWTKVISQYTKGSGQPAEVDHVWGRRITYTFSNDSA